MPINDVPENLKKMLYTVFYHQKMMPHINLKNLINLWLDKENNSIIKYLQDNKINKITNYFKNWKQVKNKFNSTEQKIRDIEINVDQFLSFNSVVDLMNTEDEKQAKLKRVWEHFNKEKLTNFKFFHNNFSFCFCNERYLYF